MRLIMFLAVIGLVSLTACRFDSGQEISGNITQPLDSLSTAGKRSARSGAIKVGQQAQGLCGEPDKEHNQFDGGSTAAIYFNNPTGPDGDVINWYTIDCKYGPDQICTEAKFRWCASIDPNYYFFDFTVPGTSDGDRCTLTLWTNDECTTKIGSDSWIDPGA